MLKFHQIVTKKISGLIILWMITLLPVNALASVEKAVPQKLLVGAMVAPPLVLPPN